MINIFVFALVSFLFWGKMTKEEEERTENASWVRTMVYLTLTLLFGVFYMKTYQVATIKNVIQVDGHRCSHNTQTGAIVDTIDFIHIMNRYTQSKIFAELSKFSVNNDTLLREIDDKGGLYFQHTLRCDSLTQFRQHSEDLYNQIPGVGHNYTIVYYATKIPSMSFVQPKFEADSMKYPDPEGHFLQNDLTCDMSEIYNGGKDTLLNFIGPHGICDIYNVITYHLDSLKSYKKSLKHTINSYDINSFNFFTAADISQCSYILGIHSRCPVKKFGVSFDIPVEYSHIPYDIDVKSAYGFEINDTTTMKELENSFVVMHVKFPTLANMQLIRSLILTTFLSALVSLFLSNLYFLICRIIRYFRIRIPAVREPHLLKLRTRTYKILSILLCILIFIICLCIYYDKLLWFGRFGYNFAIKSIISFIWVSIASIVLFEYLIRKK